MSEAGAKQTAFAIVAHPDDIEFFAAGTLLRLKEAGYETHYMTLSGGDCGSASLAANVIRQVRRGESQRAAEILGAIWHPALSDDLQIVYDVALLRKLVPVMRAVNPSIVLTHSPEDYMEDHMETSRLVVTATFARGMPNFGTTPPSAISTGDAAIYHGMPHGLVDPLRRPVVPDCFVDTTGLQETKAAALAAHSSQKEWLDQSQGMDSYLHEQERVSLEVGRMSGQFEHAEGWRRRLHLGFSGEEIDPLREALGDRCLANPLWPTG